MEEKNKLKTQVINAVSNEDWENAAKGLHLILLHLPEFSWIVNDDTWEEQVLHSLCHEIGEAIYAKAGLAMLQKIWYEIDDKMSGMGSNPLEKYWDGCGNGAWEA